MDIWEKLYTQAKKEYHPEDVTPFVYAHHVVCALESADGTIYTGFCIEACSGVMNLCAERVAALNMYVNSGQTKIRRLIAFRDEAPSGGGSGMPCGACREFLYQLNEENENMEIMVNYETRETVTLKDLMPNMKKHPALEDTCDTVLSLLSGSFALLAVGFVWVKELIGRKNNKKD